jgi:probable addiction module antidote protein
MGNNIWKKTQADPAEYIKTKEDIVNALAKAFEKNDIACALDAMSDIIRSDGFSSIARERGQVKEAFYQAIAPTGTPTAESILKLLGILGFRLAVVPKNR